MRRLLTPFFILCLLLPHSALGKSDDHELRRRLRTSRMSHAWDRCGRMFSAISQSKKGIPILWGTIGVSLVAGVYAIWAMRSERIMEDFEEGPLPHEDDVDPDDFTRMVTFATFTEERLTRTEDFLKNVDRRSDVFSESLRKSFELATGPMDALTHPRRQIIQRRILHLFQFLPKSKDDNFKLLSDAATDPYKKESVRDVAMETILKLKLLDKEYIADLSQLIQWRGTDFSEWIDDFKADLEPHIFWDFIQLYYLNSTQQDKERAHHMWEDKQDALLKAIEITKPIFEGAPKDTLRNLTDLMVEDYLDEQSSTESMFADVSFHRRMKAMLALVEKVGLSSGHLARLHSSTAPYKKELLQAHKSATEGKQ